MITIIKKGTPRDEIKRRLDKIISKKTSSNILKYAGKLKTVIDPVEYQKQMRDEWQ
jgi:hypothetical protein